MERVMDLEEQTNFLIEMTSPAPIHPDLEPHITTGPMGRMLHHPYVIDIMYHPTMNKRLNKLYEYKNKSIDEAISEEKWARFVFLHERPYRLDALVSIIRDYGETRQDVILPLLADVWTDSENIYQNFKTWTELWRGKWSSQPLDRTFVLSEADNAAFKALPDRLTIYRGWVKHKGSIGSHGLSWTLNRDKAVWFAKRFQSDKPAFLSTMEIDKQNILAYFTQRNEDEVVVLRKHILEVKSEQIL